MTSAIIPSTAIITPLIKMFNMCPDGPTLLSGKPAMRKKLFKTALTKGYLINPLCLNEYAEAFIDSIDMQYNSTFYKTWTDVTNKSRAQLLFDQIFHYVTTYGVNFSLEGTGCEYIPNTNPEEPAWTTYKVIDVCTFKDLYKKCMDMICSGIALKSETVKVLTTYIVTYCNNTGIRPDVDSIKNREALVIICDELGVLPKDGAKLFAHIVYKTTGETMIIKNRDFRNRIINAMNYSGRDKIESIRRIWRGLTNSQLIALAEVYNRYKPLFLSYKSKNDSFLNAIINRIGHLSKKYHKPMTRGFWETLLIKESYNPVEVAEKAKTATNYKLIQVMQSIRERLLLAAGMGDNLYIVRNGKIFMKENNYSAISSKYFNWEEIYNICNKSLP